MGTLAFLLNMPNIIPKMIPKPIPNTISIIGNKINLVQSSGIKSKIVWCPPPSVNYKLIKIVKTVIDIISSNDAAVIKIVFTPFLFPYPLEEIPIIPETTTTGETADNIYPTNNAKNHVHPNI